MKRMTNKELRDFLYENCKRIGFPKKKQLLFNETSQKKDLSLFATRLIKKNT